MTDSSFRGAQHSRRMLHPGLRFARVAAGVLAVTVPFVAILWLGVPAWFPTAIALDTVTLVKPGAVWNDPAWSLAGRLFWSFLVAASVVAAFALRGWWGKWLPLAVMLAGLAVPQACVWATGQSKSMGIGGLIPYNDGCGYFDYACKMLENHRIVAGFTDRPMFSAMLSSIFQFTGMDLQPMFAVWLAFAGIGMFVATREMQIRFGNTAAICFLFVIYTYYNRSIGTLMTEHLGLALALLSFPLLLRGVLETRLWIWMAGLLLLSTALSARSGAYFVLLALCVVTVRRFGGPMRRKILVGVIAISAIVAPLLLNRLLLVQTFDRATRPGSNFIYAAYGMLRGTDWHDGWNTYGTDTKKLRAATLQLFKEKPYMVLHAIRRALRTYFWESYSFTFMGQDWTRLLNYAFIFGFALAVARASRSPYDEFATATGIGIIASVPFVPPADCDLMRAYAATMPLHACIAASGVCALVRLVAPAFRRSLREPLPLIDARKSPDNIPMVAMVTGGVTLVLVFVLPIGRAIFTKRQSEFVQLTEKQPRDFPPGLMIHLVPDDAPRTWLHTVRIGDFREKLGGLQGFIYPKEAAWLAQLRPGISMLSAGNRKIILFATEKLQQPDSRVEFDRFQVAWLPLAVDRDLGIPIPEGATLDDTAEQKNSK